MNAELKAKWVAALRSGEYPQTTGKLYRTVAEDIDGEIIPRGFCCLGVLCDIIDPDAWVPRLNGKSNKWVDKEADDGGLMSESCAILPSSLRERLNFKSKFATSPLIAMNDDGKPFSKIADFIEENL